MRRVIITIPANKVDDANAWVVANIDPDGGNTFIANLNPSGDARRPATHAACSWLMADDDYDLVTAEFASGWGARVAQGMTTLDPPTNGRVSGRDERLSAGVKKMVML